MSTFKDWFKKTLGHGQKEPNWQVLLDCIGMGEGGKDQIEWREFVTAATNRYRLIMNEENLQAAFKLLDSDGSGDVTIDELQECFASGNLGNQENENALSDDTPINGTTW